MAEYFITGTDTGVGKTWATLALMASLQNKGEIVVGMKPVASGCQNTSAGLRNDDAVRIIKQSNNQCDQTIKYKTVNPYAFEQAIAPHIAAELAGVKIDIERIASEFSTLKNDADCVLVEGVGGWSVPLGADIMLAEIIGDDRRYLRLVSKMLEYGRLDRIHTPRLVDIVPLGEGIGVVHVDDNDVHFLVVVP